MNQDNTQSYNWLGVMDFIQSEYSKNQLREKEWTFERQSLLNKITKLEAESKMHQTVHLDLLKRIHILETALRDQRSTKGASTKKTLDLQAAQIRRTQDELQAQKKCNEPCPHHQFLQKILNQVGIELSSQSKSLKEIESKHQHRNIFNLVSHLDGVRDIFYSPNTQCLTSVSEDCLIKFWDLSVLEKKGEVEAKISVREHTGPLFTVSGTPSDSENNLVFTGDCEGIIKAWEVPSFKETSSNYGELIKGSWLVGEETVIWQLAYQEDKLVTSSSDSTIKIHNLSYDYKQSSLKSIRADMSKTFVNKQRQTNSILNPTCVSWYNSSSIINGYNDSNILTIWDLNSQKISETFRYSVSQNPNSVYNQPNRLVVNSVMGLVLSAHEDNCVRAFDVGSKKQVKKLDHKDSVSCIAVSNRNKWCMYSSSHDGVVKIWDLRKNLCLQELKNIHLKKYNQSIHSLLYVDELCSIITAGADGLIKIFQS